MTLKNPNLPDAGWDPIASDAVPFSGDFWMAPSYAIHVDDITNASGGTEVKISSNLLVTGDTSLNKTLTVTGSTLLKDTLTVDKKTTLNDALDVSGYSHFFDNVLIDKNATVNENFYVSGEEAKIKNYLEVVGYEYIQGKDADDYGLKVVNKIYAGSGVDIAGDLDVSGNLYVTGEGKTAFIKNLSATFATITSATITKVDIVESESYGYIMHTTAEAPKIIDIQSLTAGVNNFYLSGDTLYSNSWGYFEGELKTASAFYADGPVMFADTLNVTGKATFDNEISAASSITTKENLYVSGNETVSGFGKFGTYVSAASSDADGYGLIVEKKANIKGNTEIGGTLGVTGQTTMTTFLATENGTIQGIGTIGTLEVTGDATFNGDVSIASGDTTITTLYAPTIYAGTIDASGDVTIDGDVNVISGGGLHVNGEVIFDDDLHVSGDTTLKNTAVSGTLGVTGATTLNNTLNVSGNTTLKNTSVSGMLGVTGQVSMANNLRVDGYTTMNNKLLIASGGCDIVGSVSAVNGVSTNTGFYLVRNPDVLCKIGPDGSMFSILTDDATLLEYYGIDIVAKAPNIQQTLRFTYKPSDAKWAVFLGRNGGSSTGHTLYIPNLDGTLARIEDINSSLTSYATKQYVDDKIGDINTILDAINGEEI